MCVYLFMLNPFGHPQAAVDGTCVTFWSHKRFAGIAWIRLVYLVRWFMKYLDDAWNFAYTPQPPLIAITYEPKRQVWFLMLMTWNLYTQLRYFWNNEAGLKIPAFVEAGSSISFTKTCHCHPGESDKPHHMLRRNLPVTLVVFECISRSRQPHPRVLLQKKAWHFYRGSSGCQVRSGMVVRW